MKISRLNRFVRLHIEITSCGLQQLSGSVIVTIAKHAYISIEGIQPRLDLGERSILAIVILDEVIPIARFTRKTKERKHNFAVTRPDVAAFIQLMVSFTLQLAPGAFFAFIKNAERAEFAPFDEPI